MSLRYNALTGALNWGINWSFLAASLVGSANGNFVATPYRNGTPLYYAQQVKTNWPVLGYTYHGTVSGPWGFGNRFEMFARITGSRGYAQEYVFCN